MNRVVNLVRRGSTPLLATGRPERPSTNEETVGEEMERRIVYDTPSRVFPLALFLFLFSIYLLTYSPQFHSSDGLAMFATAESLVRRGEWDADQIRWMGLGQGIFGSDGHLYIRKGIGVSLLALPLVWLGMITPIWGAATTTLLFNALVTAATGALVLRYLQALGYDDGVALAAGLIFGLATPAWPYAKTFFSDPLAGLCLAGAALALLYYHKSGRPIHAFWAGLALAVAVAARYANAVLVPLYALLLLKYQISALHRPDRRHGSADANASDEKSLISNLKSQAWRAWVAFGIPLVATAIALAYYNLARYGNPLNTGYLPEESFSGVWWQGVAGMLISPGRGLLLYAPALLITLAAAPAFFRQHRAEAALDWALIIAHVLLYGKWFMWHGGYAWGPRFMVPTLPFFVIGMAPAIERAKEPSWWRRGIVLLIVLSVLIQILGLSAHFELFQTRLLDTGLPLFAPITFFAPRYSPLIGQFQFLRPEYLDFAWINAGHVDWPLLAALIVAVLASGWWLWKTGRLPGDPPSNHPTIQPPNHPITQLPNHPTIQPPNHPITQPSNHPITQPSNHLIFPSSILPILLTLTATVWLLARAHALQPDDLAGAVSTLNANTTASDAVITGTPDDSVAVADLYTGRADVLGLSAGAPFDEDTTGILAKTVEKHPRVWWLPNWLPPEDIGIERWLMGHGFRVQESAFGQQRLVQFYFPPQPLAEATLRATFGDAIVLEHAVIAPTSQPGGVLPVALHWKAKQPMWEDYHVFVHLLDLEGNRIAQSDNQPALWTRPTSSWTPGELVEDRHALALPENLPAGDYTLVAGLYLPASGERLLTASGEPLVSLGTIRVQK